MVNNKAPVENNLYWLSVVVIGKNEGKRLPDLFASLPKAEDIEWIYVDSHSSDNSMAIARTQGAKVFLVEKSSVYAPATGRHIGTKEAAGRWILYLDGDMVLEQKFIDFVTRLKTEEALPYGTAGFVGRTCNYYLDQAGLIKAERDYITLSKKEMGSPQSWGKPASYHGGAVLYLRKAVLEAGNWNPAVYQLEEVDLYSRIKAKGGILRAIDLPMVRHYTPGLSFSEKIKLNFYPQWREKRLYGAGQVVAARIKEGTLTSFIKVYPYPFVIFAGLVTTPLLYLLWPSLPLIINLLIVLWIGVSKKWYYYLVYLGNLVQIMHGLNQYQPFEPDYRQLD